MSSDFISMFMEYTQGIPSPAIFRKWAAVAAVGGALERRCYTRASSSKLYPNSMILLIANPGVGKSMAINEVHDLWSAAGMFNVAATSLTRAAFVDQLQSQPKTNVHAGVPEVYHSLLIPSPELGTLIKAHDLDFLNTLNDVYDCRNVFEERTRTNGTLKIDSPHLSLLGGTQPKYLSEIMPEQAWGMGFTSRLLMIYAAERVTVPLFSGIHKSGTLRKELIERTKTLGRMHGEFTWEKEAATAAEEWHFAGCPPTPHHVRLQNYNTRRILHVLKLSMAISASRSPELVITLADYEEAKRMLVHAEHQMPEIFKEMNTGSDSDLLTEVYNYCVASYAKTNKPLRENLIISFLSMRTPVAKISFVLQTLIQSGLLEVFGDQGPHARTFIPKPRPEL